MFPGARLFSGEWYQETNSCRTAAAVADGSSTPRSITVRRARPSASVIWVSSVTSAGRGSSISRQGPYAARIAGMPWNSVG